MPGQRQADLFDRDAAAVVDNRDPFHATLFEPDGDLRGIRIEGVFQQLLDHCGRPFNYLARGDLGYQLIGQGGNHARIRQGRIHGTIIPAQRRCRVRLRTIASRAVVYHFGPAHRLGLNRKNMDFMHFVDLILHVDKYLGTFITDYGSLVYAVLFGIVFCETGLVVLPFLPGDTLLFIAGAFCAEGKISLAILIALLFAAAVLGNTVNYLIGRAIGQKVFTHNYRWLDQAALLRTHAFYEKHGGKTIVLSRFVPIVRTFAPFVAGVSEMGFASFQLYNLTGALAWVGGLSLAGYFFGNIPLIREHLSAIVLLGVAAAVVPLILGGLWKLSRRARSR